MPWKLYFAQVQVLTSPVSVLEVQLLMNMALIDHRLLLLLHKLALSLLIWLLVLISRKAMSGQVSLILMLKSSLVKEHHHLKGNAICLSFVSCLTGSRSFNRKSLHHIGNVQNPYEQAISIIGKTLSVFDEDNLIPCFGFGDGNWTQSTVSSPALFLVEPSYLDHVNYLNFLYILVASTHDQDVFSFYQDEHYCNGFEEVLARYREIVPHLRLAGAAASL